MSRFHVALLQNESEMLRYGLADIRPMISHFEYTWTHYTTETLTTLFGDIRLKRVDALIVATNALNDKNLLQVFQEDANRSIIAEFLKDGGGIFISLQRRLADNSSYTFLPEELKILFHSRPPGEAGNDGDLEIPQSQASHILLNAPNRITAKATTATCLNNEFVKNLYIAYVEPTHPKSYEILLVDHGHSPLRSLLIASRSTHPGRVVASAIPLDWQGHQGLLDNVVRYVVEGHPHIAVIKREGTDFADFQYLIANLEVTKVAFTQYRQKDLDLSQLPVHLHTTFLLDPGFTQAEIEKAGLHNLKKFLPHGETLIYFEFLTPDMPVINAIGGRTSRQAMLPQVASWLRSVYKNGQWNNSFWHTFDVLETFHAMNISVEEYRGEVLEPIRPKIRGGSYDEVMGASCAVLKLYSIFNCKNEFKETLGWIREKYKSVSLFERASALDCLIEVNYTVTDHDMEAFKQEANIGTMSADNEMRIYRIAKTLYSCGFYDDCLRLCQTFRKTQAPLGSWVNLSRTASIVVLLIFIRRKLGDKARSVDDMLFRAVTFIKSGYDPVNGNWNNDVSATAKSIRAICFFEETLKLPVDEILVNLRLHSEEGHMGRLVEHIAIRNAELSNEVYLFKTQFASAERQNREAIVAARITGVLLTICLTILAYCAVQFNTRERLTLLWVHFKGFVALCSFDLSFWVVTIPWIALYIFFRSYEILPKFAISILEQWEAVASAIKSKFKSK